MPTSYRLISRRSWTRPVKRRMSSLSNASAVWLRGDICSRLLLSTSADAVSVISGDRSSWLTSEAKRASTLDSVPRAIEPFH